MPNERSAMNKPDLPPSVTAFIECTRGFKTGRAGKEFLVLPDELEGYAPTPLEQALIKAFDVLEADLRVSSSEISPEIIAALVTALGNLSPGADSYRARMMKAAGDYADEDSTAKYIGEKVLALILDCLRAAEAAGRNPLAEVPKAVLEMPLSLDSQGRSAGTTVFRRLYRDGMQTFSHAAFSPFFEADHANIASLVASLKSAPDEAKRGIIRQLIGVSLDTDLRGKRLVDEALLTALEDPCDEARYEAREGLETARSRIYPRILDLMGSSRPETRRLVVGILLTLYLDCYDSKLKAGIRQDLTAATKDPDSSVSRAASEAIQKINWKER